MGKSFYGLAQVIPPDIGAFEADNMLKTLRREKKVLEQRNENLGSSVEIFYVNKCDDFFSNLFDFPNIFEVYNDFIFRNRTLWTEQKTKIEEELQKSRDQNAGLKKKLGAGVLIFICFVPAEKICFPCKVLGITVYFLKNTVKRNQKPPRRSCGRLGDCESVLWK